MKTKYMLRGIAALACIAGVSAQASAQNLLENGDFSSGGVQWDLPGWWVGGSGTVSIEDGVFCVDVDSAEGPSWGAALKQSGLSFIGGESYTLTFDAWASTPIYLPIEVYDGQEHFWLFGSDVLVDAPFDGEPNAVSYTATVAESSPDAYFRILFGGGIVPAGATVCLSNLNLSVTGAHGGGFMSFEDPTRLWTSPQVSPVVSTVPGGQHGDFALSVHGSGYVEVSSPIFHTDELDTVTQTLAIDVLLSQAQSNPWWRGDLGVFVSIPSAGIYHEWVGRAGFETLTPGTWGTVAVSLPSALRQALSGSHPDAQLHIAVNTNNSAGATLLDNVRFTSH